MKPTLSRDDFDALAEGGGGSDAIERLRAGVYRRQVVMTAALLEIAEARSDVDLPSLAVGLELLDAVQAASPAAASALLTHPHTGMWLARCLARLQGRTGPASVPLHADLGRLAAMAAAAAIRAGYPFELEMPMWDGAVLLPTMGLANLGATGDFGMATVRHTSLGTEVTGAGRRVQVPDDPTLEAPGWQGIRRLVSEASGRRIEIEVDDLDPGRDGLGKTLARRLETDRLDCWRSTLDEAWVILAGEHSARADALAAGLTVLVPADAEPGSSGSVTSRYGFGSVVMSLPRDGVLMAETMIHEFQHSKLYALMEQIPLYRAEPPARYYSPWREDPRPFGGLLQGAYAYIGVTDFWQRQRLVASGASRQFADFQFARWRRQVARAVDTMLDSGRLTEDGTVFVQAMGAHVEQWRRVTIPPRAKRLAQTAITDHHLVWRLHNLAVDPETVDRLVRRWRDGVPRPAAPQVVPSMVAADPTPWPVWGRGQLAYREMHTPAALDEVRLEATDADFALLRGDDVLAARMYQEAIVARPGDTMAWAGLAQAIDDQHPAGSVLRAVPELVYAVHHAIAANGSTPPQPLALAGWLATARGPGQVAEGVPICDATP